MNYFPELGVVLSEYGFGPEVLMPSGVRKNDGDTVGPRPETLPNLHK
jgi:hypothetical protein